jgi:serine/threonine protein kinase
LQYSDFFIESYGWYKTIDTLFLAMEFVEHGDLTTHMAEPFPEAQVRQIIYQVLGGLSHMHGSGYVHRDLKPAVYFSPRS